MKEYLDLLKALNFEGVRYVVVGGFASVLYGASTVTFDLDLAIALDDTNGAALIRALTPFKPFPPQYGSAENFVWDERSLFGSVMTFMTSVGKIDLLRVLPEIESFDALLSRAQAREVDSVRFLIASVDDLITMKAAAGRPKDLEHIRQLLAFKDLHEE